MPCQKFPCYPSFLLYQPLIKLPVVTLNPLLTHCFLYPCMAYDYHDTPRASQSITFVYTHCHYTLSHVFIQCFYTCPLGRCSRKLLRTIWCGHLHIYCMLDNYRFYNWQATATENSTTQPESVSALPCFWEYYGYFLFSHNQNIAWFCFYQYYRTYYHLFSWFFFMG